MRGYRLVIGIDSQIPNELVPLDFGGRFTKFSDTIINLISFVYSTKYSLYFAEYFGRDG